MTIILRRSLIFRQEDNLGIDNLYQSLCQAVRLEIANWPDIRDKPDLRDSWLNADCSSGYETANMTCRKLCDNTDATRLMHTRLIHQDHDFRWAVNLKLGRIRDDEVNLLDEWDFEWTVSAFRQSIPYETATDLLAFTDKYCGKNVDGLQVGKPYTVGSHRIGAFTEFVKSPERCLPIVVISRTNEDRRWPIDATSLAQRVQGVAHLIKLKDDSAARQLLKSLSVHPCYNGAVRIYWPGYKVSDARELHPYWPLRSGDETSIPNEVFARIAERSPLCSVKMVNEIDELEKQLSECERNRQQKQHEMQFREEIEHRLKEQTDTDWERWNLEYTEVEKERNRLREESARLRSENSGLERENRNLRWRINSSALQKVQQGKPEDEQSITSLIFLSSKAYKQYRSFDANEKGYWDKHILGKMSDEQLRENQSEPVHGPNGPCWVYPRSGTASGQRLFYYNEGSSIFICELFREHDSRYDELRTQGVDREAYGGFDIPWCETMTDS